MNNLNVIELHITKKLLERKLRDLRDVVGDKDFLDLEYLSEDEKLDKILSIGRYQTLLDIVNKRTDEVF